MTLRIASGAAALLAVMATAAPARAQATTTFEPLVEFSLGYQLLSAGEACGPEEIVDGQVVQICEPDRVYPLGFAIDFARYFDQLGVIGEFGWSRESEDEVNFTAWHLAGGLRYTFRNTPRVVPYGQLLAGFVRENAESDLAEIDADTSFMFQPGGGVYFAAGDRWGVFGQIDLRHLFLDDDRLASSRNDVRVFLGIRFGFQ